MATARLVGDLITLDVAHRENDLAKMTPGMRYHPRGDEHSSRPHFVFPLAWASCVALRGVFGANLTIDEQLSKWARSELETRIQPALELRNETDLDRRIHGFDERLRPYQTQASSFLSTAGQAILADSMRVGKTPESISALRFLDARPALIVVPTSTRYQWLDEVSTWWPEATPINIRGSATERRKAIAEIAEGRADVGIIGWEALRLHTRLEGFGSVVAIARCEAHGGDGSVTEAKCEAHPKELNEIAFRAVVADEAHRAAHPRTKQARALWAVGWKAEYRFALTGTPVLDSPEDLWALMHWISPDEAPQKTLWIDRYCLTGMNLWGLEILGLREDTKAELFSYVDPRFLRRTREMVMPWLPEKIYVERTVELGAKQRKAYNEMRDEMLAELDNGEQTYVTNSLSKLTRLRQFASAYAHINEDGDLKLTAPSCKVEAMIEIAEELGGKPAVVFAESKQLIVLAGAALTKHGYEVGYVTGDVTDDERAGFVTAFQRGELQFLLVTLGAGGEGLTLDRADVVIFLQRSFSMAKNRQAEDRIVGQTSGPGLEVIDIVARDTIEARVQEVLGDKERISEEILRDRSTFERLLK